MMKNLELEGVLIAVAIGVLLFATPIIGYGIGKILGSVLR
jgi:putative Mn2+ efflux pump MntP